MWRLRCAKAQLRKSRSPEITSVQRPHILMDGERPRGCKEIPIEPEESPLKTRTSSAKQIASEYESQRDTLRAGHIQRALT